MTESKLLRHEGDLWQIHLRMVKKQILTVVLNGDFDVQYRALENNRWSVISRSTRIAEMDGNRELPPGTSRGFLWRINAYWLIEPRPEGVYLECRAVSLSRGIPFGLGLAQPFLLLPDQLDELVMLPTGFHVQIAQTDLVQFRCVTSPISPKPPTPAS